MAEINKLSVGQALDKLRRPDAPESKQTEATGSEAQRASEGRANTKSPFSMPAWMVLASVGSLLAVLIIIYTALAH
jgi:hypothetical protein